MAELHIGIDMHGTLIDDRSERVPERLVAPLAEAMEKAKFFGAKLYLCTGNDLSFVRRKLPQDIIDLFDGHVLEMGCVVSDGEKEEVLPSSDILGKLKNLETALKSSKIPEIYKFAERRAIISMFTFYGTPPEALLPKVNAVIQQLGMGGEVKAACSSVAVDVFPDGFSKMAGMRHVARGGKVMGIADSMNDAELVAGADAAVVPSNSKKELLRHVAGMKHVRVSSLPSTEAVIESLELVGKPGAA